MKTVAPKKAEFCLLLKKEIESLNAIERYRLDLKKEKLAKKELSIMEKVHKYSICFSIPKSMIFWYIQCFTFITVYHIWFTLNDDFRVSPPGP
jgi:hypothetical protein